MTVMEYLIGRTKTEDTHRLQRPESVIAQRVTRQLLELLFPARELRNVNVRIWDGALWPTSEPRAATIVLNRPSALREMFLPGTESGVGEAYLDGAFDIEGNIEAAFEIADLLMVRTDGWTRQLQLGHLLRQLPEGPSVKKAQAHQASLRGERHSLARDRKAIQFHYNVSNNFYALWLDKSMAYSCAYFNSPNESLDVAQQNKFEHICRKLELKQNQRLLDIGCGWGGLLLHAVRYYGVEAVGITLSKEQYDFVQQRIEEEGLSGRASVCMLDYRELVAEELYDAIVSVGMVEHVGREKLPTYFEKAMHLLKPGGLFLNHGIGLGPIKLLGESGSFISKHVFPDADLISISQMLQYAEKIGWEIRDVESLREHYAMTLRHWVSRLESHHLESLQFVNEYDYRTWRLYMAGCAHQFQAGRLSIYQTLLAKITDKGKSAAPLVRAGWYQ